MMMSQNIDRVLNHLYIGSVFSLSPQNIQNANIKLIIDCTVEGNGRNFSGVERLQVPIEDNHSANIGDYFDLCADHIERTKKLGGSTLIHCMAGVSRSATICIYYLMKYQRMRLRHAYEKLKSIRFVIRPNEHFFEQLILFEYRLFGSNTVSMVNSTYGRIPDVYEKTFFNFMPTYGVAGK